MTRSGIRRDLLDDGRDHDLPRPGDVAAGPGLPVADVLAVARSDGLFTRRRVGAGAAGGRFREIARMSPNAY